MISQAPNSNQLAGPSFKVDLSRVKISNQFILRFIAVSRFWELNLMKGIIFTEFIELVESKHGLQLADQIISATDLHSQGAYTAVGTYDHRELVQLVEELSRRVELSPAAVLKEFGKHLFTRFRELYPHFFDGIENAFDFLKAVDSNIHVEVRKLYPDAELPRFEWKSPSAERLILTYRSKRSLSPVAEGLIEGCADYFGENLALHTKDLSDGKGTVVEFSLIRQG